MFFVSSRAAQRGKFHGFQLPEFSALFCGLAQLLGVPNPIPPSSAEEEGEINATVTK